MNEIWTDYEVLLDVIYHAMTEQGLEFCEEDCNHIAKKVIGFVENNKTKEEVN